MSLNLFRVIRSWLLILGLAAAIVPAVQAQSQVFYAEVVKIDHEQKRVTLKAVMGHKSLRVQRPELLEGLKVGDQVLFETGQDGPEVIITVLTITKK